MKKKQKNLFLSTKIYSFFGSHGVIFDFFSKNLLIFFCYWRRFVCYIEVYIWETIFLGLYKGICRKKRNLHLADFTKKIFFFLFFFLIRLNDMEKKTAPKHIGEKKHPNVHGKLTTNQYKTTYPSMFYLVYIGILGL